MIAGVDEAGRGPLAGPVVAAAVILNHSRQIRGLKDSKLLSATQREKFYEKITEKALAYSIAFATVEEIDEHNILQATLLAMKRAVEGLSVNPLEVWVDGRDKPRVSCRVRTFINGDNLIESISAASILAKVARDRYMIQLDQQYPDYGFASHKGYSTAKHFKTLNQFGPSPVHRRSFAPVALLLNRKAG